MEITPIHVTIANLTKNYKDDDDGGVFDYDDRLTIRPAYQLGLFAQKIKKNKGPATCCSRSFGYISNSTGKEYPIHLS